MYMLRVGLGWSQSRVLSNFVCGVFRYLKQNVQEFQRRQYAISGMSCDIDCDYITLSNDARGYVATYVPLCVGPSKSRQA